MPRRLAALFLAIAFALAACAGGPSAPVSGGATSGPGTAPVAVSAAPGPGAPTATPTPVQLVVCQTVEPLSLYLYGDDTGARAGILSALFDGPVDSAGFAYQPVILDTLPSLENDAATVAEVEVRPGDQVVDAATGAVTPLAEGVTLAQRDGTRLVYAGSDPARTLQVSAQFTLKAGLQWSDGAPLTADDSVFSYELAADPGTPRSKFLTDRTASYLAADARTVRWTGLPGWADTQFFLRFWTPVPRHRYGGLSAAALQTNAEANQDPLAWGPFVMKEWVAGDHLTVMRNPDYFRAGEGLPRVDEVKFRFGLDAGQILTELLAGRCDIGSPQADFSGALATLLAAESGGTLTPQFALSTTFEHLDFNIQPAADYTRGAGADLFADAHLRQAFADCLDRPALTAQLLNGLSEVPAVYVPSTHPLYAADRVTLYPFDPARGQALLAEAGWLDNNGDGVRDRNGRPLALTYISGPPDNVFRQNLMALVQAQLRTNCGIDLRPELHTPEELFDPWPAGLFFGRRFDVGEFPWRTGIEPPCGLYLSEAVPGDQNPGGANDTGYSNPDFDAACRAAGAAFDDATHRAQHAQAQAIFTQDLPSLPLFWRVTAGVARPAVSGYRVDSTASELWNIEDLSVSR
jgi:peptide/nickel transport system substrate-binding protein